MNGPTWKAGIATSIRQTAPGFPSSPEVEATPKPPLQGEPTRRAAAAGGASPLQQCPPLHGVHTLRCSARPPPRGGRSQMPPRNIHNVPRFLSSTYATSASLPLLLTNAMSCYLSRLGEVAIIQNSEGCIRMKLPNTPFLFCDVFHCFVRVCDS